MKKPKLEKGITLVALIITIIVLLILAVVSIGAIKNSKIISHSQNSADEYIVAQENGIITKVSSSTEGGTDNPSGSEGGNGGSGSETTMPVATIDVVVNENSTINGEAYSSSNPVIPPGFKAINVTTAGHESSWTAEDGPEVSKGLIISDGTSEFVWIPVPSINAFARATSETDANGNINYRGVLYDWDTDSTGNTEYEWSTYSTNYREPANLSSSYDSTSKMTIWTETLYQESFNKMVKSVVEYEGFYVGRYETSMNAEGTKAQSKSGETPMTYLNWYTMYTNSLTYSTTNTNLGVISEMICGCQWDAMVKFIGSDIKSTGGNTSRETGSVDTDKIKNIYDLIGNSYEWTQEAAYAGYRVVRGGDFIHGYSPSIRFLPRADMQRRQQLWFPPHTLCRAVSCENQNWRM